jgi:hypothetical protein
VFVLFLLFWLVDSMHDLKERVMFIERKLIDKSYGTEEKRPTQEDGRIEDERDAGDAGSDDSRVACGELASKGNGCHWFSIGGRWARLLGWCGDRQCAGSIQGPAVAVHWRRAGRTGLRIDVGREDTTDGDGVWGRLAGIGGEAAQPANAGFGADDLGEGSKGRGLHLLSIDYFLPSRVVGKAVMEEVAKLHGGDCDCGVGTPESLCRDWAGGVDQGEPVRLAKNFNHQDKGLAERSSRNFFRKAWLGRQSWQATVARIRVDESIPLSAGEEAEEIQGPAATHRQKAFASSGGWKTAGGAEAKAANTANGSGGAGNRRRATSLHSSIA